MDHSIKLKLFFILSILILSNGCSNVKDSTPVSINDYDNTLPTPDNGLNNPILSLNGSSIISIPIGTVFIDPGATATDKAGNNLTDAIITVGLDNVDTNVFGSYIITYSISNSLGLGDTKTRTINVVKIVDTQPPVISNISSNLQISISGNTSTISASDQTINDFLNAVTASDDVDGIISVSNNAPNTFNLGVTAVTFTATDSSGNTSSIISTVIVFSDALSCNELIERCYDIVYVRYPSVRKDGKRFIGIPQGENPTSVAPGADLILLKKGGNEIVLVDCITCSVMDPMISFDGEWVYYSLFTNVDNPSQKASWIYKIHIKNIISDASLKIPIRMTFDNGSNSAQHATNTSPNDHYFNSSRHIIDISPVPLADGRILFVSNRSALIPFHPGTKTIENPVMQLYVMDDHDGSAITPELANMKRLETGSLHLVQHPIQLKDGRILFSSWQDVGQKFTYAMTNLMTIHPDGSNLQQFTEPHDHHKNLDHFITQLTNGDIISGYYYPSFDYGFGLLMRYPLNPDPNGIDFVRNPKDIALNKDDAAFREFIRKGTVSLTPHTTSADRPAPNLSGKYSMPSAGLFNNLLTAYSPGSVNFFSAKCTEISHIDNLGNKIITREDQCDDLKSGIYLIPNAASNIYIEDPIQLIKIKDDPLYNEIWPKAVLPYKDIYGQDKPNLLATNLLNGPQDNRLDLGEAHSLIGTSSMYNREGINEPDDYAPKIHRETHRGNWLIQGADAGVFSNSDIYGVRIISTPPIPFTSITPKTDEINRYLQDSRLKEVIARYGSYTGEGWKILGEFPLAHKQVLDPQVNPDSSWLAKIPADTPTLIQTIDKNGMTLTSELTWRGLKSGEKRADCGGCHSHSIPHVNIANTETGKRAPIKNILGINNNDPRIQNGLWDLTTGSTPLLSNNGVDTEVTFVNGQSYTVEFNRDIVPIINTHCVSCHTANGSANMLILDGVGPTADAWVALSKKPNPNGVPSIVTPQKSRYIRVPQARQSLLTWVVWGKRLDGRINSTRNNDVDYSQSLHTAHTAVVATLSDLEKRTVARWIDLGGPIDFNNKDGFSYTQDPHLPVINIQTPQIGGNSVNSRLIIGFADADSGLDLNSVDILYYPTNQLDGVLNTIDPSAPLEGLETTIHQMISSPLPIQSIDIDSKNILNIALPAAMQSGQEYVIVVTVLDLIGNRGKASVRFIR